MEMPNATTNAAQRARKPLMADTPLEVEDVWLRMQRERGPLWRLQRAVELTTFCWRAAREGVRRMRPDAPPEEVDRILLTERYGEEAARNVVRLRREKGFYDVDT